MTDQKKKSIGQQLKEMPVGKQAATAAGAMALVSAGATAMNYISAKGAAEAYTDGMITMTPIAAIGPGIIKAGKVAVGSGLAVIGAHKISDYMQKNKKG